MMTTIAYDDLSLTNLTPTRTALELAESSRFFTVGIIKDIMVTLDSWKYPIYFFVVHPKYSS